MKLTNLFQGNYKTLLVILDFIVCFLSLQIYLVIIFSESKCAGLERGCMYMSVNKNLPTYLFIHRTVTEIVRNYWFGSLYCKIFQKTIKSVNLLNTQNAPFTISMYVREQSYETTNLCISLQFMVTKPVLCKRATNRSVTWVALCH